MLALEISDEARRDLAVIWRYTLEQWSPSQADTYYQGIQSAMTLLLDNPDGGTPVLIRPGTRKLVWESHVVYYRVTNDAVRIVRVLHYSMDVGRHLT